MASPHSGPAASLIEVSRLYAAALESRPVSQTQLALAAQVPETTALRLTQKLVESRLIARTRDTADKRLVLFTLTDACTTRVAAYLRVALASGAFVP